MSATKARMEDDDEAVPPAGRVDEPELMFSVLRQHELTEAVAERLNAELQAEIAARKRTEEALSASELRYHRLFESAKDGILLLDADKNVNPSLAEMLGYSHDDMVGKGRSGKSAL